MSEPAPGDDAGNGVGANGNDKPKHSAKNTIIGVVITIVVLVGVFGFAIPKFANYHDVLAAMGDLTTTSLVLLGIGCIVTMLTFWWINMAALPGLKLWPSAVVTQSAYAVANTVPAGGPISLGVTYKILRDYLFRTNDIVMMVGIGGIWNVLGKFVTPVIAVALLFLSGDHSDGIELAAIVGLAVLAVSFGLLALIMWKESAARRFGNLLGRVGSWILARFHKPPVDGMGDKVVDFRARTLTVVRKRWPALTGAAIVNQLAFFLVLFLSLRGVGVTSEQMDLAEMFAAFAFARVASSVPITPGGVGTTELFFIGLLVSAGGPKPEVVAGVLLYRTVTYLIPIPVGAVIYLIWKATFKDAPSPYPASEVASAESA